MGRPRKPLAIVKATGRDKVNPARYDRRIEPLNGAIGDPPGYLSEQERRYWAQFVFEMSWLRVSDTALLEMAVKLRARVESPDCGSRTLALFRSVLNDLGGSPTRRSNVDAPDANQRDMFEDPGEAFFNDPTDKYLNWKGR